VLWHGSTALCSAMRCFMGAARGCDGRIVSTARPPEHSPHQCCFAPSPCCPAEVQAGGPWVRSPTALRTPGFNLLEGHLARVRLGPTLVGQSLRAAERAAQRAELEA